MFTNKDKNQKNNKKELIHALVKTFLGGGMALFFVLLIIFFIFVKPQIEKEKNQDSYLTSSYYSWMDRELEKCIQEGLIWSNEEHTCYNREEEQNKCVTLEAFERDEIKNLPDYLNTQNGTINISSCPINDNVFMCNNMEFIVFSGDFLTVHDCKNGYTVGMSSEYNYKDVRYLGENESIPDNPDSGMAFVPYDADKCVVKYYRAMNIDYTNENKIELCWV